MKTNYSNYAIEILDDIHYKAVNVHVAVDIVCLDKTEFISQVKLARNKWKQQAGSASTDAEMLSFITSQLNCRLVGEYIVNSPPHHESLDGYMVLARTRQVLPIDTIHPSYIANLVRVAIDSPSDLDGMENTKGEIIGLTVVTIATHDVLVKGDTKYQPKLTVVKDQTSK